MRIERRTQERAKIRAAMATMSQEEIEYWIFRLLMFSHMDRDTIQAQLKARVIAPNEAFPS